MVANWLLIIETISSIGFWERSVMLCNTRFLLPLPIILKMCWYHSLLFEDEKSSDLRELKLIFAFLITLVTLLERCLQRSNSLLRYAFCLSIGLFCHHHTSVLRYWLCVDWYWILLGPLSVFSCPQNHTPS